MPLTTLLVVLVVGAATGFLGGLFGKGGSALATPVLAALGVPPIVAVASPLPATVPGTLLAARQYARQGLVDRRVLGWSAAIGLPATLVGAWLTRWVTADDLVVATDVLVAALGASILIGARRGAARGRRAAAPAPGPEAAAAARARAGAGAAGTKSPVGPGGAEVPEELRIAAPVAVRPDQDIATDDPPTATGTAIAAGAGRAATPPTAAMAGVALLVGLVAGLLANSGGFLLAPLFLVVLRLPVRPALGTSLAVSAALAVPGTVAHAALGHVDWALVLAFGAASVPLSALGARTALRIDPRRLEAAFGAVLVVLATVLLTWG